ncbi:DUF6882 domain-containing protein [Bradyrhizobium roseum]|uniref:DUF6882 domain-containing protein n=1 Tax=Bradyrhizobium roseum TaxID=3056648 RepID=UPI00261B254A|nr:DUF6882 domain-containing protein [Bradyrhizobium roseus]WKA28934.1 hypothetical protein QUH67_01665 [Bradyrhizobium roseus]
MSIFGWMEKLLAGDQNAAPPDARVERDAKGRIVSVSQTLSPGGTAATDAHPKLVLGEGLHARLGEACDWLTNRNISLARAHGIGLEETYAFDQDEGRLELIFSDGRKIVASGQLIGSFDPRDRTFLWAWANPSIHQELLEDAQCAQAEGQRMGDAALTTPIQTADFGQLTALLALVSQISGADGLYRCITNGSTSVFVTFRIDAHLLPDGTKVDAGAFFADRASDEMLASAAILARSYDGEMFAIDRIYHERGDESMQAINGLLAKKLDIYQRYWSRDDDEWKPCSFGWPSGHDPATVKACFTAPHVLGGALDISIGKMVRKTIYRFERVGGDLKITDQLIEWGEGFVWPAAP